MHTLTNREEPARRGKSAAVAPSPGIPSGQISAPNRTAQLQRAIGNRGVQRAPQIAAGQPSLSPTPAMSTASGGDAAEASARLRAGAGESGDQHGLPGRLRAGLESLSGLDLSGVRVHNNSEKPARLDAVAYAQGEDIYLGPGQNMHLPHEGWHVVQQMQGRVARATLRIDDVAINSDPDLEAEADRMGTRALEGPVAGRQERSQPRSRFYGQPGQPAQRQVRINGGAARVNEAEYRRGGARSSVGTRFSVASLIADSVRRVFTGVAELESYANGQTDYIGDVATTSAGRYWYRLPERRLTVLGEQHHNPAGNVEDVILGLRTHRFMYEPFNELASVAALNIPFTGTQARLTQINSGIGVGGLVDRRNFNPDLENIVFKALAGATLVRNGFAAANPPAMGPAERRAWGRRASTSDYSGGERAALYLAMGIHLASDISRHDFGRENFVESLFILSGRRLKEYYLRNQAVLDSFMTTKDGDDLIGIYELTSPGNFQNLAVINGFTLVLHEYASRYIERLGADRGNAVLQTQGEALSRNLGATLDDLSPAREEVMWGRIQHANANGYLIVGMGDAHRQNLQARLALAGIAEEEVTASLTRQRAAVNAGWTP